MRQNQMTNSASAGAFNGGSIRQHGKRFNSTSKMETKSNDSRRGSVNYGQILYEKGMKRKEELKHAIQRARSE